MSGENKVEVRLRPADNNWTGGDLGAGGAIAEHSVSTLPASKFYLIFCFLFSLLCLIIVLNFWSFCCFNHVLLAILFDFSIWYHYFSTLFQPSTFDCLRPMITIYPSKTAKTENWITKLCFQLILCVSALCWILGWDGWVRNAVVSLPTEVLAEASHSSLAPAGWVSSDANPLPSPLQV